jgi:hypothetical protein
MMPIKERRISPPLPKVARARRVHREVKRSSVTEAPRTLRKDGFLCRCPIDKGNGFREMPRAKERTENLSLFLSFLLGERLLDPDFRDRANSLSLWAL